MIKIFDNYYLFQINDVQMLSNGFLRHNNDRVLDEFIVGPNDIVYCNYLAYLSFLFQNKVFQNVLNSRKDFESKYIEGLMINDERAYAGYFDDSNESINFSLGSPQGYDNCLKGSSTTLKIWFCDYYPIDDYKKFDLRTLSKWLNENKFYQKYGVAETISIKKNLKFCLSFDKLPINYSLPIAFKFSL